MTVQEPAELPSGAITPSNIGDFAAVVYQKDPTQAGLKQLALQNLKTLLDYNSYKADNLATLLGYPKGGGSGDYDYSGEVLPGPGDEPPLKDKVEALLYNTGTPSTKNTEATPISNIVGNGEGLGGDTLTERAVADDGRLGSLESKVGDAALYGGKTLTQVVGPNDLGEGNTLTGLVNDLLAAVGSGGGGTPAVGLTERVTNLENSVGNESLAAGKTLTGLMGGGSLADGKTVTGIIGDADLGTDKTITGVIGNAQLYANKTLTEVVGNVNLGTDKTLTGVAHDLDDAVNNSSTGLKALVGNESLGAGKTLTGLMGASALPDGKTVTGIIGDAALSAGHPSTLTEAVNDINQTLDQMKGGVYVFQGSVNNTTVQTEIVAKKDELEGGWVWNAGTVNEPLQFSFPNPENTGYDTYKFNQGANFAYVKPEEGKVYGTFDELGSVADVSALSEKVAKLESRFVNEGVIPNPGDWNSDGLTGMFLITAYRGGGSPETFAFMAQLEGGRMQTLSVMDLSNNFSNGFELNSSTGKISNKVNLTSLNVFKLSVVQ